MSEVAVNAKDIEVAFKLYEKRPTSFKENLLTWFSRTEAEQFKALKGLSFEVPKGKVFGVIGSNGAGKSTLLKVLSGVLDPTAGKVTTSGSVDSLIQLGAGFDPELSAVENIFLNGSLHQMTAKEIRARVPSILDFAELHHFKDTPIKYYSSGMAARLGFSVAIDRDPDILIVDEVLAVGDDRFQNKCELLFDEFLANGKTLILVTHNLSWAAERCDEIMLLSCGQKIFQGNPNEAVELYHREDYKIALG